MKRTYTNELALAARLISLAGCGGGGSSIASGFPDAPKPPSTTGFVPQGPGIDGGTTMRSYQPGDVLIYDVQGTITKDVLTNGSLQSVNSSVTGTDTVTVTLDNNVPAGLPPLLKVTDKLTYVASALGNLPVVEITEVYLQKTTDANSAPCYSEVGRRDLDLATFSTVGLPALPLTWGASTSTGGYVQFAGTKLPTVANGLPSVGTTDVTTTLAVLGQESLASSSTSYNTWKTSRSEHSIVNIDITQMLPPIGTENLWEGYIMRRDRQLDSTEWWSPVLSGAAKRSVIMNDTDTVLQSWTYNAQSNTLTIVPLTEHATLDLTMVLHSRNTG